MDEALLIDMMSGLDPVLLQNNYIEKDLNRGKIPILNRFFSSKKASIFQYNNIFHNTGNINILNDKVYSEDAVVTCSAEELKIPEEDGSYDRGLNISIFKRGFPSLITVVSGIAATFVVLSGIILFVVRHHKNIVKLFDKKAQIIY